MKPICWAFSLVPVCYFLLGIDKSEQYGEDMEETKEQQGIKQGLAWDDCQTCPVGDTGQQEEQQNKGVSFQQGPSVK